MRVEKSDVGCNWQIPQRTGWAKLDVKVSEWSESVSLSLHDHFAMAALTASNSRSLHPKAGQY